jgi:hypothetical protein
MRSVAKEVQAGALGVSCLIPGSTTGPPDRPAVSTRRFPNQAQIGAIWKYNVSREMGEHKTDSAPSSSDSQAGSLQ